MGRVRAIFYVILTGISLVTFFQLYDMYRFFAEHKAEFRPVLSEDRIIGGINMPAGTELELNEANDLETFRTAKFPQPVRFIGMDALIVNRYYHRGSAAKHRVLNYTPRNIWLSGIGESLQNGWNCDATYSITFETNDDGSIKTFERCVAATGNMIEGSPLPPGSKIRVSDGTLWSDGTFDPDRWNIALPDTTDFGAGDIIQRGRGSA